MADNTTQNDNLPKIVIIILSICIGACLCYFIADVFNLPPFGIVIGGILVMWLIGLKLL